MSLYVRMLMGETSDKPAETHRRTVPVGEIDDLAARMAALTPDEQSEVLVKAISRRLRSPVQESGDGC